MISIRFDPEKLEDAMKSTASNNGDLNFFLNVFFTIDDADLSHGGEIIPCMFFCNLNWMVQQIDPERLQGCNFHFDSDDNRITGDLFTITWNYDPATDNLDLTYDDYTKPVESDEKSVVTTTLKKFSLAVLNANNKFLIDTCRIWPEIVKDEYYIWIQEGMETIRHWHEEKYRELVVFDAC